GGHPLPGECDRDATRGRKVLRYRDLKLRVLPHLLDLGNEPLPLALDRDPDNNIEPSPAVAATVPDLSNAASQVPPCRAVPIQCELTALAIPRNGLRHLELPSAGDRNDFRVLNELRAIERRPDKEPAEVRILHWRRLSL